jgi:hypothetical protein
MRIEETIEKTVVNVAERAGWEARKLGWIGRRGAPDRLFMRPGRAVFIEFKDPEGELEDLQEREIDRMRKAGLEVYVIDSIQDGFDVLGLKNPRA